MYSDAGGGDWETDESVFHRLPMPPNRPTTLNNKRSFGELSSAVNSTLAKRQELAGDAVDEPRYFATMLRYRRSDGMMLDGSPLHSSLDPIFLHQATKIREINNFALADVRRADLIILHKAPMPLPLKSSAYGAFVRQIETVDDDEELTQAQEESYADFALTAHELLLTVIGRLLEDPSTSCDEENHQLPSKPPRSEEQVFRMETTKPRLPPQSDASPNFTFRPTATVIRTTTHVVLAQSTIIFELLSTLGMETKP